MIITTFYISFRLGSERNKSDFIEVYSVGRKMSVGSLIFMKKVRIWSARTIKNRIRYIKCKY